MSLLNSRIEAWRKLSILCAVMLFLSFSLDSMPSEQTVADRDAAGTEFFREYLDRLKKEKTFVFYAKCKLKGDGEAGLLVPVGTAQGFFVELTKERTVVNSAEVKWDRGQFQTEVAQGGLYTIKRANDLANELLGGNFKLVAADQLSKFANEGSLTTCKRE